MAKKRVFADTNAIFEAFRTGCWTALSSHYSVETVEKCVEEALTGNRSKSGYIDVPIANLDAGLAAQHKVTKSNLKALRIRCESSYVIDAGEEHLFAWLSASNLLPSQNAVVVTADKRAIEVADRLGWLDCMTSLESLLRKAGAGRAILKKLYPLHTEKWLSKVKTQIKLGMLL